MRGTIRISTPQETREIQEVVSAYLIENQPDIQAVAVRGQIPIVVLDPSSQWELLLSQIGWDGASAVFPMGRVYRRVLAAHSDPTTARWLRRTTGPLRVFLVIHSGSLLLNIDPEAMTIRIEPGSTDAEHWGTRINATGGTA